MAEVKSTSAGRKKSLKGISFNAGASLWAQNKFQNETITFYLATGGLHDILKNQLRNLLLKQQNPEYDPH